MTLKGIGATAVVVLLLAAVVVGGWRLGWWMTAAGTNYRAQIYQHSYGAQSAYREQLRQKITDVTTVDVQLHDPKTPADERPALVAQRTAMVNQACDLASKITGALPSDEASFVATTCQGGTP